jgi:xanthine/uracil permease
MSSGRSEWLWHSRSQKNRYKLISLIASIIFGAACTLVLTLVIFSNTGQWPDSRLVWVMFGTAAAATIFIQWLRVIISVFRDSRGDIRPLDVWFGSFETNTLLPLVMPPLVAAFSYWFVAPLL